MQEKLRSLLGRDIKKYTDAKEEYNNALEEYIKAMGKVGVDDKRKAMIKENYENAKLKQEVYARILAEFIVDLADEF